MSPRERERTLENIVRLARAEHQGANSEVGAVREDLEAQLEGTVSRSAAARRLGVSHTALNHWIEAGDVPVVITRQGRKEVPIAAFLELEERVARERKVDLRKRHLLEPAMVEARHRADRMRPRALILGKGGQPHRRAELRGLAYHRALAPRLRRPMIDQAQNKLQRWRTEGRIDPRYAEAWEEVFALPMTEIRKVIAADDERGRDLRQNSPLAGLLNEPEPRRILENV